MKDNKLIAEFMGLKPCDDREQYQSSVHTNVVADLKYHTSWDWLMPVIQKILDISFQGDGDAEDFNCIIDCIPDINQTYKAVVEFIKEEEQVN